MFLPGRREGEGGRERGGEGGRMLWCFFYKDTNPIMDITPMTSSKPNLIISQRPHLQIPSLGIRASTYECLGRGSGRHNSLHSTWVYHPLIISLWVVVGVGERSTFQSSKVNCFGLIIYCVSCFHFIVPSPT